MPYSVNKLRFESTEKNHWNAYPGDSDVPVGRIRLSKGTYELYLIYEPIREFESLGGALGDAQEWWDLLVGGFISEFRGQDHGS